MNTRSQKHNSLICLIRPPAAESFRFATTSITLPMGIAFIASALEATGRNVTVIDAVGEAPSIQTRYYIGYNVGLPLPQIVERIPHEAKIIGISVIFTHEWPAAVHLINLIKEARPDAKIILGGEHITSMPEFSLATSKADVLVLGEGEESIVELVDALENDTDLNGISGIAFHDKNVIVVNKRRARRADVDNIAWPNWNHINIQAYHDNRFIGGVYSDRLTIPILATRGCPYQCTFCSSPNNWTTKWIPRDPKKVVDEIEFYVKKYNAGNFPFQDLTAIIRKDWIVEFCQELIDRKLDISWQLSSGTRSEAIDQEVADYLKKTNMTNMAYAPESGSDKTRQIIKKKVGADKMFESIRATAKANLNVSAFIIVGFPHDNHENLKENLPFIDKLAENGVTDTAVGYLMALPGTELFHSLYDAGKIKLDIKYFRHLLSSNSLLPSLNYCDNLSNLDMLTWKIRMLLRFYSAKKGMTTEKTGLMVSIRHGLSGLIGKEAHQSKLQTAFRNAMIIGWQTIVSSFKKPWLSRKQERDMIESWDKIYRDIQSEKIRMGVIERYPSDTTQLYKTNVNPSLARMHQGIRLANIKGG